MIYQAKVVEIKAYSPSSEGTPPTWFLAAVDHKKIRPVIRSAPGSSQCIIGYEINTHGSVHENWEHANFEDYIIYSANGLRVVPAAEFAASYEPVPEPEV